MGAEPRMERAEPQHERTSAAARRFLRRNSRDGSARQAIAPYLEEMHWRLTQGLWPVGGRADEPQLQGHADTSGAIWTSKRILEGMPRPLSARESTQHVRDCSRAVHVRGSRVIVGTGRGRNVQDHRPVGVLAVARPLAGALPWNMTLAHRIRLQLGHPSSWPRRLDGLTWASPRGLSSASSSRSSAASCSAPTSRLARPCPACCWQCSFGDGRCWLCAACRLSRTPWPALCRPGWCNSARRYSAAASRGPGAGRADDRRRDPGRRGRAGHRRRRDGRADWPRRAGGLHGQHHGVPGMARAVPPTAAAGAQRPGVLVRPRRGPADEPGAGKHPARLALARGAGAWPRGVRRRWSSSGARAALQRWFPHADRGACPPPVSAPRRHEIKFMQIIGI